MSEWEETMWKRKAAPYAKFCKALCGARASAATEKSLMGPAQAERSRGRTTLINTFSLCSSDIESSLNQQFLDY